ncbi:HNH nuclease domain-containing protein [Tsukamurella hominis]
MVWVGAISTPDGYGRIRVRTGPARSEVATVSAHRFALWLAAGHLEAEGVAEHDCNEPLCVRVADEHVHASTQSANMLHAIDSGRHRGSDLVVDSARRAERSFRVRELVRSGCWSAAEYAAARSAGTDESGALDELLLW